MKIIINFFCYLSILIFISTNINAADKLQKLTVILDWYVNPDHAPLFVAQQQGFYRDLGLDVQFITPADPADPPKLVAAGKADLAIDYQPHLLLEIANKLPVVQVGTLVPTPLACLAVLQRGPIITIKQLKGKNIGYSVETIDRAILRGMLQYNSINLNDVNLINVKYDLVQGLLAKKIDGAMGLMRNFEIIQLQLLGQPARVFYPEKNGVPSYSELIFISNSEKQNDPRIAIFLKAVAMGTQYLRLHPEETWKVFAKNHPELNNELTHRAWFATIPYFTLKPEVVDKAQFKKLEEYLSLSTPTLPRPPATPSIRPPATQK